MKGGSSLVFEQLQQPLSVIAAKCQLGAVPQDHGIIAAEHRMKLFYPVDINDRRAVDTKEFVRVELGFDAVHSLADHVCISTRMQLDIVSSRLDPVDLVHFQKENAADRFHDQSLKVFFLGPQV